MSSRDSDPRTTLVVVSLVSMEIQGSPVDGYLAFSESGSGPAVLVIQE